MLCKLNYNLRLKLKSLQMQSSKKITRAEASSSEEMKTESDFKNSDVGSESISAIRDKRQNKHAKKREKRFSNATEKPREESKVVNSEEAQKTVKPLEKDAKMLLT